MSTVLPYPETLFAALTSASKARMQVDEVMKHDREFQEKKVEIVNQPGVDFKLGQREIGVYVWLDSHCYGNGWPGYYYVRYHHPATHCSTAYDTPALIVKKSKLRPDQVAFMERKCQETKMACKWD